MTPYYDDGQVTIYHGDCRDILPRLDGVDLVLTDPPYGIAFQKGRSGNAVKGRKSLRRNPDPIAGDAEPFDPSLILSFPNVVTWGANHYAKRLPDGGRWLVWDKLDGMETFDSFSDVEIAWCSDKGADRIFRYLWKGVCQAGEKGAPKFHVSQKPLALMKWCLSFFPDAEVVVDPYMGSGTTLRAAKDLGLRAIGIELEERYCEIAVKRLAQSVLPLEIA